MAKASSIAALSDELLEQEVVGRRLHIATVSLNESLDLLDFEILSILKRQLINYLHVYRDGVQTHYDSTIILRIDLAVTFVLEHVIDLVESGRVCIKDLCDEIPALRAHGGRDLIVSV